jgi:hypothetical protein
MFLKIISESETVTSLPCPVAHTSTGGSNDVGGDTDSTQPIITIVIGGTTVATGKTQQVKFRVQSTATTRSLDN